MIDYTKFDAALLAEIKAVPRGFTQLCDGRTELYALAASCGGITPTWRIFDRRLEALRRAGKIRYAGKVWEAIDG